MTRRFRKDMSPTTLLKSDSDDENYDERAERAERSPRKSRKIAPSAKKRKGGGGASRSKSRRDDYPSEEDDDISEVTADEDEDEDDDAIQYGATGRPVRASASKKQATYKEPSDDEPSDDETEDIESSGEDDNADEGGEGDGDDDDDENDDVITTRKPGRKTSIKDSSHSLQPTQSKRRRGPSVIRLKLGKKLCVSLREQYTDTPSSAAGLRRSNRSASAGPSQQHRTTGGKGPLKAPGKVPSKSRGRGVSLEPSMGSGVGFGMGTRRSSRLGHTDEPMAALSNSGRHVVVTGIPPPTDPVILEENSLEDIDEPSVETGIPDAAAKLSNGTDSQPEEADSKEGQQPQAGDLREASHIESVSRDDTGHEADEEEEEEGGPTLRTRNRITVSRQLTSPAKESRDTGPGSLDKSKDETMGTRRLERRGKISRATSRKAGDDEDEYQEEGGAEESDDSMASKKNSAAKSTVDQDSDEGADAPDSDAGSRNTRSRNKRTRNSGSEDPESQAELAAELEDLRPSPKRPRRTVRRFASGNESGTATEPRLRRRTQQVDYRVIRPEMAAVLDDNDGIHTPSKRKPPSVLAPAKSLFDTNGPFGGGEVVPFFGRTTAPLDIDSDSSDDDAIRRRARAGAAFSGPVALTPGGAHVPGLLPGAVQTHNSDAIQTGAPANLGKVTRPGKNALADADPLGVSPDITFASVGGLDDRIQQLKEMVMLPLMYPEIFLAKKIVPPRGVLFHGPPGTGKTLLARAVASSFTDANGKKVTFYMRKGADCLSKWVGEAERQLRLLFEEARNNQPSIIFFDEIDGLAPVRSSKQEQIHASIVSTLLALMDGMDGRGQVVVIGATNRPDSVDPALRRPGRFDREFYFPLPTAEARRSIIEIHSSGWEPPLSDSFKDQLARLTKGYGGADLRALCTEAALNAMQRTYPQIYKSLDKLKVDPSNVVVTARDFMMSLKKITPSSERSTTSGAAPLPEHVQPLLSRQLDRIKECLKTIFPEFKRLTPLEEAEYEDDVIDVEEGFEREMMMENFENARVYRPRLLIHGSSGLGQHYLAAATLHFMEKVHVQSFDLGTLLSDATRSPETAVVQFFTEVKRHKPSVIFIPNVDVWYRTLPETAIATFKGLLQSVAPNDRVLLFGIAEVPIEDLEERLVRDFFGFSKRDRFELSRPDEHSRFLYFEKVMSHIRKSPRDFPQDLSNRKKKKLLELERASPPPVREQTDEEKRSVALRDRQLKNHLKIRLNALMENLKQKYRRFKKPVIDHDILMRILNPRPPPDPDMAVADIPPPGPQLERFRPFVDDQGVPRVEDTLANKVFYNLDLDVIEDRFSNGYYSTPRQFLIDLERIRHDAKLVGEKENQRKANEMLTNSEVYIADIEMDVAFTAQCEEMYEREKKRRAEREAQAERKKRERRIVAEGVPAASNVVSYSTNGINGSGRIQDAPPIIPKTPISKVHDESVMSNGVSDTGATIGNSEPPNLSILRRESNFSSLFPTPQHISVMASGPSTQMTQMGSATGGTVGFARLQTMDLSMIVNDASTTTSGGKRTSDGTTASLQYSHPYSNHSNGLGGPRPVDLPQWGDFGVLPKGDSQLPATQLLPSSAEAQHSSQGYPPSAPASQPIPPMFPYHQTNSSPASMPNPDRIFQIPPPPIPELTCTPHFLREIHDKLTKRSSGYTIEQLEQVNAAIMDHVWRSKTNYNRDDVARQAYDVFLDVNSDVKALQNMMAASVSFD